jgi:hypothetical protein
MMNSQGQNNDTDYHVELSMILRKVSRFKVQWLLLPPFPQLHLLCDASSIIIFKSSDDNPTCYQDVQSDK